VGGGGELIITECNNVVIENTSGNVVGVETNFVVLTLFLRKLG